MIDLDSIDAQAPKSIYYDSNDIISKIRSGDVPKGSIIKVQWPSGNSEYVRVHGWSKTFNKMSGCNMGWDNLATELYDLCKGVVSLIEEPKANDRRWKPVTALKAKGGE
ncbi:hypothetical protein AHiyo8_59120 [Arthrobacter sp. Hiyo8]|uniref:hypothetical protein n=1 Tax=Arthrobacter sp. Hiyo1 TaxID=1588020 RepID=UPI00068382AE|nr:hypothetical protein [Arthrobacter sp. Hiyo1]BAS17609.1 hypothetical protein AHiyo8_59120 [Arthrobacter sp. Hiyo8]GAP57967.1 hypothetical protein AHiyo1_09290 [Arthrobacter sp. Hiyo1]